MKTPKIGDTVTISKPGLFNGCIGEVLANNPDIKNSLTVILENNAGTWSFSYSDIGVPKTKDNAVVGLKTSDTPKPEIVKDVIEILEKVGFKPVKENEGKQKRKYTRRDKTEVKVTKIKRTYNRKAK